MNQERLVRVNDIQFMTKEFFIEVQTALFAFPKAENIHFLINAWGGNLKVNEPVNERWNRYDVRFSISLGDIRQLVEDPNLFTATVLTKLCNAFRQNLILH